MGKIANALLDIVKPIAQRHDVSFSSAAEMRIRYLGKAIEAEEKTIEEAIDMIDDECHGYLERRDKEDLMKTLTRMAS